MKRKKFGNILIVLGLCLLGLGVGFVAGFLWTEEQAGSRAEHAMEQLLVQMQQYATADEALPEATEPVLSPEPPQQESLQAMQEVIIDGVGYVGYLQIPALELTLPVIGQCSEELLEIAPCRYFSTAYQKNFVIGGHRYRRHFRKLYTLGYGDRLIFTDVTGKRFSYQVEELEEVEPYEGEYICSGDWDLTLFTCTTGGTSRLVVRCLKQ